MLDGTADLARQETSVSNFFLNKSKLKNNNSTLNQNASQSGQKNLSEKSHLKERKCCEVCVMVNKFMPNMRHEEKGNTHHNKSMTTDSKIFLTTSAHLQSDDRYAIQQHFTQSQFIKK